METKQGGSRWFVVIGALMVQLCLGAIYAWGTFTPTLQAGKAELVATLTPKLLGLTPEDQADVKKAFAPFKSMAVDPRGAVVASIKGQIAEFTDPKAAAQAKIDKMHPVVPWFAFDAQITKLMNKATGYSAKPTAEVEQKRLEDRINVTLADPKEVDAAKAKALAKITALCPKLDALVAPETLDKVKAAVMAQPGADAALKAAACEIKADAKDKAAADANIGAEKKAAKEMIGLLEADAPNFDPEKQADQIKANGIIKKVPEATWKKFKFGFKATEGQYPFMAGLFFFALAMIFAGRWQDKSGPKIVALTGGVILGVGYILGSFAGNGLLPMVVCVGAIGGIGIGLGYVCPIAACVKWFPDKKGLITGLAVAGFGAGAYVFAKVGAGFVFANGISAAFMYLGIIFAVGVVLGALLLSNPPAGYKPAGWNPPAPAGGATAAPKKDFVQGEIVKTSSFWMTWLAFMFSAGCGLMVIGSLKDFAINQGGLDAATATAALGFLALFNGLGRVVWGTVTQKIGPRMALIIMLILQACMMFVLLGMGSAPGTLALAACWIGFNFGGNFAIFPLITADSFGVKNLGQNYGVMFTAYGIGGIVGPFLAGKIWDTLGSYQMAFIPAGVGCLLAMLLAVMIRPPKSA